MMASLLRSGLVVSWRGCFYARSAGLGSRAALSPSICIPSATKSVTPPLHSTTDSKDHSQNGSQQESTGWTMLACAGVAMSLSLFALKKTMDKNRQFTPLRTAQCVDDDGRSKRFNFLAEAVEIASPSVVFIEKSQRVATLFGEMVGVSSGSGFIVCDGRYVLTNAHVVANSRSVKVKLVNGRVVAGEVTEIDTVSDLALIKLDLPRGEKLQPVKFGSSSNLRPGEWVVALGSPLNLTNTITAGIVSSVLRPSRELGLEQYKPDMEYVQTDAPITHGNSGGPLVNLDGEVIGVNTMTAGPGISFAIPSDFAQSFINRANKTARGKGPITRYAIGVSMLSVSPSVMRVVLQRMPLPEEVDHGVFLANVWANSPAAQAGLMKGDVIVRINDKEVYSGKDVNEMVQKGKKMSMDVARKGKWVVVNVVPEPLYAED